MRIPEETVERIRQSADILEVINDFVSLKKRGSNYIACCPFHNEKTPSFNVNPVRQIYKCFGCGKAGDAVKFVMDIENIGYGDALRYLAKKYGIEIEEQEQTPEELLRQNERESLHIVLNFAKTYFQENLQNTDEGKGIGLSYFRERGFTNPTIDAFDLGYSMDLWDGLLQEATRRGYSRDMLEKAGLILTKENNKVFDRFRGRVMFPIHNVSGRVIAFGARILKADKTQPKYLNSPETPVYHKSQVLYGIFQAKQAIRQEDVCFLTEGYTDVISLHQAGIKNVVASSGTSLTTEQIRLIARFTPNVTILYDGDAAGIKAALRGLDMVLEEGLNLKLLLLPDGEDPDSYVHKVGADAFKEYIKNKSQDYILFNLDLAEQDILTKNQPAEKAEIVRNIAALIGRVTEQSLQDIYIEEAANRLGINSEVFRNEVRSIVKKNTSKKEKERNDYLNQISISEQFGVLERLSESEIEQLIRDKEEYNSLKQLTTGKESINKKSDVERTEETIRREKERILETLNRNKANKANRVSNVALQEEECIRLLINYGARELEPGITLCQYMLDELHEIDFQTSPYNLILALFREAYSRGDILTATDFLNRPHDDDAAIQQQAIHLTTPRYEISDGWEKHEIFVPSEEEISILADAAYRNILRIKKMLAEQRMASLQQQLREAINSPDESDRLMLEFMQMKRVDMQISQLLGTVISG